MAQILGDNTVVPSFQGLIRRGHAEDTGNLNNLALRMGEVKAIVYPDDPQSITKQLIEYSVEVQHRDNRRAGTTSMYLGCLLVNLFGGSADVLRYTLRKDDQSNTGKDGIGVGSKVLMLCVNGQTTRAMIIGGLRDLKVDAELKEKKEDGHNLFFEFNGFSVAVNDSGEAKIQFRGATKVDGKLDGSRGADDAHGPTTIEFLKNGNLHIYTKDGAQSMLIDHENKKATFLFDTEWNVKVNEKVVEDYGTSWACTVGSTISIEAQESISQKAGTDWNMTAGGNVFIKSSGVMTGGASDATMMGTTYRNAQATLHQTLLSQLATLSVQLGIAGAAATGPLAIPVVGGTIAGPIIGSALVAAVAAVAQMIAALTTFEGQGLTYLSLKNKSD